MSPGPYHNPSIETMDRGELDALIDERIRYTVKYAADNSSFYRNGSRNMGYHLPISSAMKICWNCQLSTAVQ